jgi:hypothetical protein
MDSEPPKVAWVADLPAGPDDKVALGRLVDEDGGRDEAENSYYETAADPGYVARERDQRRFRGAYLRHLRRLSSRSRDRRPDEG